MFQLSLYLFSLPYLPVRNRICKFFLHVHAHKRDIFSSIDKGSFPVKYKIILKNFKWFEKWFFLISNEYMYIKHFSHWPCSFSHTKHTKPAFSICLFYDFQNFLLLININLTYHFFANSIHLDTLYYSNWRHIEQIWFPITNTVLSLPSKLKKLNKF